MSLVLAHAHTKAIWGTEAGDKTSDLIRRCKMILHYGGTHADVYDLCVSEGLSGEQSYLVYIAADLLLKSEEGR